MKLQLKKTQVEELSIKALPANSDVDEGFSYEVSFTDEQRDLAFIVFDFNLVTSEGFHVSIKFKAIFGTDKELTEEERGSKFFSVNAPAIAFPFLRAYVSNLLLQSGMEPIVLPSVNFAAMVKEKVE